MSRTISDDHYDIPFFLRVAAATARYVLLMNAMSPSPGIERKGAEMPRSGSKKIGWGGNKTRVMVPQNGLGDLLRWDSLVCPRMPQDETIRGNWDGGAKIPSDDINLDDAHASVRSHCIAPIPR